MNFKRDLLLIVVSAMSALTACNWTVGDCYPREEWEGTGGNPVWGPVPVFSSSGSGDFGDAPPGDPQDVEGRKLQCNKTEDSEESSGDSPRDSSESPASRTCSGLGDKTGDGQTSVFCSSDCSSKCPPAAVNGFSPSIFHFVTIVEDDGAATPGGWQEAAVNFKIKRWVDILPESWSCPMTIGVPLRNESQGKISAELAAALSAKTATAASRDVMKSDIHMPQGIFCFKFTEEMKRRMPKIVGGARVTKP